MSSIHQRVRQGLFDAWKLAHEDGDHEGDPLVCAEPICEAMAALSNDLGTYVEPAPHMPAAIVEVNIDPVTGKTQIRRSDGLRETFTIPLPELRRAVSAPAGEGTVPEGTSAKLDPAGLQFLRDMMAGPALTMSGMVGKACPGVLKTHGKCGATIPGGQTYCWPCFHASQGIPAGQKCHDRKCPDCHGGKGYEP